MFTWPFYQIFPINGFSDTITSHRSQVVTLHETQGYRAMVDSNMEIHRTSQTQYSSNLRSLPRSTNQISQQVSTNRQTRNYTSTIDADGNTTLQKLFCDYCGQQFKSQRSLREHKMRHEGKERYWCDMCNKGFMNKSHFEGHMNTHMGRTPYQCEKCLKQFPYRQSLRNHLHSVCTGSSQ